MTTADMALLITACAQLLAAMAQMLALLWRLR